MATVESALKIRLRCSKIILLQAEIEAAVAANVSKIGDTGLDIPVISAFEGREKKLKRSLFSTRKEEIVCIFLAPMFAELLIHYLSSWSIEALWRQDYPMRSSSVLTQTTAISAISPEEVSYFVKLFV